MILPVSSLSLERLRSEQTVLVSERRSPLEIEAGSSAHCTVGTEKGDACYQVVRTGLLIKCHCWVLIGKKGTGNASPSLLELGRCVLMIPEQLASCMEGVRQCAQELDITVQVLQDWGTGAPFVLTVPRKWILTEGTDWCCSPEGCVPSL